ncbi:MAG: hypothetical protein KDH84_25965, partial [Calditrichaeota bacterium]|nr:hypothetical protein [Calditrichota bacterium]
AGTAIIQVRHLINVSPTPAAGKAAKTLRTGKRQGLRLAESNSDYEKTQEANKLGNHITTARRWFVFRYNSAHETHERFEISIFRSFRVFRGLKLLFYSIAATGRAKFFVALWANTFFT